MAETGAVKEDDSPTDAATAPRAREATRFGRAAAAAGSRRGLVTLALLLSMTVASLEQTVVTTAMPSILASLKGLEIYPLVFAAYLLASTVSTPLYGKLADVLGRKRVLLFGLGAFAIGSMLSGLAQSMWQLVAFRVIQGLGAGAIGPIVLTMLGDLFTLEERARVQGLFSAVWGASSLAGPAIGGELTDRLSWRWVFFVTVPFAVVSMWILITQVHEDVKKRHDATPIDWAGAFLLSAGSILLMTTVLRGADQSAWSALAMLAGTLVLFALFVRQEHRAVDPLLPIDLMLTPNIAASLACSLMIGGLLFGIDTYIPLFVQGVLGGTAIRAGRTITPLFLTWSLSVVAAAWVVRPLGFRRTAFSGSFLLAAGAIGLALGAASPVRSGPLFLGGMILIGIGMGPTSLSCLLDVQNSVPRSRRGTATGAVIFARTMGGSVGVGFLGATLGLGLSRRLADTPGIDIAAALRPETHALLTPAQLAAVQSALGRSLRDVFVEMAVIAALAIVCSLGLRPGRAESHADAGGMPGNAGMEH